MTEKIKTPNWIWDLKMAVARGRKVMVAIDNDSILVTDITDVPEDDDPRWADDDFYPYVTIEGTEDLMPCQALVDLFAAIGVKADKI